MSATKPDKSKTLFLLFARQKCCFLLHILKNHSSSCFQSGFPISVHRLLPLCYSRFTKKRESSKIVRERSKASSKTLSERQQRARFLRAALKKLCHDAAYRCQRLSQVSSSVSVFRLWPASACSPHDPCSSLSLLLSSTTSPFRFGHPSIQPAKVASLEASLIRNHGAPP